MKTRILAVLAGSVLASMSAQAADYVFTQIDYPGASQTQVFGVNNRGEAVGNGLGTAVSVSPFITDRTLRRCTVDTWPDEWCTRMMRGGTT